MNTVTEYDGVRYYYTLIKAVERTEGGCNADYGVEEEFSDGIIYCTDGAAVYSVVNDKGLDEFDISTKKFANTDGDSVKVNFSKGAYQLKIETQYYSEDENKFVTTCENHEKVFFVEDPTDYTPLTAENIKLTPSPPSCLGKSDGEIKVELIVENVGKGTLQWRKNGGNDSFISSGNLTGYLGGVNYTVEVKDDCDKVYPKIDLPSGTQLELEIMTDDEDAELITPLTCASNSDGEVDVKANIPGLASYTYYAIDSNSDSLSFTSLDSLYAISGLSNDTYSLHVTSQDCSTAESSTWQSRDFTVMPTSITIDTVGASCYGVDGQIQFTGLEKGDETSADLNLEYFVKNVANDTVSWDTIQSYADVGIDLGAGFYELSFVDLCSASSVTTTSDFELNNIQITEPSEVTTNITSSDTAFVNCADAMDGSLAFTISNGTARFDVSILDSSDSSWFSSNSTETRVFNSSNLPQLAVGSYSIQVSEVGTCSNSAEDTTFVVALNNADEVDGPIEYIAVIADSATHESYHLKCRDDFTNATLKVYGGLPKSVGLSYDVFLYKENDGEDPTLIYNTSNDLSEEEFESSTDGDTTFYTFKNLTVGTYYPQITDDNGCTKTLSNNTFEITAPAENLTLSSIGLDDFDGTDVKLRDSNFYVMCHDTAFTFKPANSIAQGGVGFYTFKMDGTEFPQTDGYSYTWDSDETQFDQTFTVTDDNGCVRTTPFTINNPPRLELSLTDNDETDYYHGKNVACNNSQGQILATASGGISSYAYSKTGFTNDTLAGSKTYASLAFPDGENSKSHSVSITDSLGCPVTNTIILHRPAPLTIGAPSYQTLSNGQNITCKDGTVDVSFSISSEEGAGLVISDGASSLSPTTNDSIKYHVLLGVGDHVITVTDKLSCYTSTSSFNLSEPTSHLTFTDNTIMTTSPACIADSDGNNDLGTITASASGGTGPSIAYPYTFTLTDDLGMLENQELSSTDGTTAFSALAKGINSRNYTLSVTDIYGCSALAQSVTMLPDQTPLTITQIPIPPSCHEGGNGSIEITISENSIPNSEGLYTFELSGGDSDVTLTRQANTRSFTFEDLVDTDMDGVSPYKVFVIDGKGCTDDGNYNSIDGIALEAPEKLTLSPIANLKPSFASQSDGMYAVGAGGGVGGYSFSTDGTDFSAPTFYSAKFIQEDVSSGNYTVYLRDANYVETQHGVCQVSEPIVVDRGRVLSLESSTATDVTCVGSSDGSITPVVEVNNRYPSEEIDYTNLSLKWEEQKSGSLTAIDVSGGSVGVIPDLASGSYTLKANYSFDYTYVDEGKLPGYNYRQNKTREAYKELEIAEPNSLVVSMTTYAAPCGLASNGTMRIEVSDSFDPNDLQYKINEEAWRAYGSSRNKTIEGLAEGSGILYVSKNDGSCQSIIPFTIDREVLLVSIEEPKNPTCSGADNGEVRLSAYFETRAAEGFVFTRVAGSTLETSSNGFFQSLGDGEHKFVVAEVGEASCQSDTVRVTLTQPDPLTASVETTEVSCDIFSARSSIEGGTSGYTIRFESTDELVADSTALGTGDYRLFVKDALGCETTVKFSVGPSTALEYENLVTTAADCSYPNGTASFTVTGGVAPYEIGDITFSEATIRLTSLYAGDTSVNVVDSRGCTMSVPIGIEQVQSFTEFSITSYPTTCSELNGALTLEISEGTAPYTIEWLNIVSTLDSIGGLGVGRYTVRVTDSYGCSVEKEGVVSSETGIQPVASRTSASPYCGLSNGALTIYDIEGGVAPYDIYQLKGTEETWLATLSTGEDLVVDELSADIYSFLVRDDNGCMYTVNGISLDEDPSLLPDYDWEVVETSSCGQSNGTLEVLPEQEGIFTYEWYDQNGTNLNIQRASASGLEAGNYTVQVTSEDNCQQELSLTLEDKALPLLTLIEKTTSPAGANNGQITVQMSGGAGAPYLYQIGNNTPQSSPVFSGLAPDTYQVTGMDAHGCVANVISIEIIATPELALRHLSSSAATCAVSQNGGASIIAGGGISPYSYFVSGEEVAAEIQNLGVGSYSATVEDAIGSTALVEFEITALPAIDVEVSSTLVSCAEGCNGTIYLTLTGGSGRYTVSWMDGSAGVSRENLCTDTYSYEVYDQSDASCVVTGSVTIEEEPALTVSLVSSSAPTCKDGVDGELKILASGGSDAYSYLWSTGATSATLRASAGTYSVTVTDRRLGCQVEASYIIDHTEEVIPLSTIIEAPRCYGTATGSARLVLDEGVSALVEWSDGQVGTLATGLAEGKYTYQIETFLGCVSSGEISIVERPALSATTTQTNITCSGQCAGEITLAISGGVSPYRIRWSHGSQSTNPKSLCADQYTYTVNDANNCQVTGVVDILEPDPLEILTTELSDLSCNAAGDGQVSVEVTGGTGAYTYSWSNGSTSNTLSGLSAGDYVLEVHDENGCRAFSSFNITQPTPLGVLRTDKINPSCYGYEDGSIEIVPFGGTAPYTVLWNDNLAGNTIEDIGSGSHTAVITDDQGCTIERTVRLSDPPGMQFSNVSFDDPTCYNGEDGRIYFDVIGGTTPYQFQWEEFDAENALSGIASGTYVVEALDDQNCTISQTFTLVNPDELDVSGMEDYYILCTGGELQLSTDASYASYLWEGPEDVSSEESTLLVTAEGEYDLTVMDQDECVGYAGTYVEISDNPLDADFIRISEAVTYEPVVFVDLTIPVPDDVRWILPEDESILISESDDVYLELIFTEPGQYEVGVEVSLSNCKAESYKTLLVEIAESTEQNSQARQKPSIQVEISPNPTADQIQLVFHAPDENILEVQLIGSDQKLVRSQSLEGSKDYLVNWNLSDTPTGVYFLIYKQGGRVQSKRILVLQ
ncbi:T9SS type A sorting domain-containing protein [Reichenbachiella sp. MSK19-1]|uniref:T9SS type A sorting domain-containing protein n=1 Tax=Reichenbachiella sp. MSK19-1 TaxID=1897631 RepID=UPI001313EE3E|nr:T9SS type A sorting domain-containing protein [Reichenbachiella sp. MSK19-1]